MNDSPQRDNSPAAGAPPPAATAAPDGAGRESAWRRAGPAVWVAAIAAALLGWQWYDTRGEIGALRQELARKLADADTQSKESRMIAEQVREAVAGAQVKLGVLEGRLAESQNQQIALEALYQELSRNRDEWAYAEIEQSLLIASQQLSLAGNVKGALIALQAADSRLQRMNRPQLTALRKAINRDIERLKVAPHVDVVAISARLDGLIAQIDKLPLAMEVRPAAAAPAGAPKPGEDSAWARFWRDAWLELKQLVRVQSMDNPEVPLLAPAQSYFLRENLKLRLIGARLALLARDAASYKADLKAARDWLNRYYDTRNSNVAYAVGMLRNLHDAEVSVETPDIAATLEAMRGLRLVRERGAR
jgi:uroporphyrin-3 C-methyltransferase